MKLRKLFFCIIIPAILISCNHEVSHKGYLLIVGGGKKPEAAVEKFVELCNGGPILIITSASAIPHESGPDAVELFAHAGARQVSYIHIADTTEANLDSVVALIKAANGIFFTGGVQSRLMDRINNTRTGTAIMEKYHKDAGVIGATSAGAAIMSDIMITGDGDFTVLKENNIVTAPGLGLLKNCIIDQHFVKRQRNNRLLSLVIEHRLTGIGIDESTAILYHPDDRFDVYGEGSVLVYDPGRMRNLAKTTSENLIAQNIKLHVLCAGISFDLGRRRFISN